MVKTPGTKPTQKLYETVMVMNLERWTVSTTKTNVDGGIFEHCYSFNQSLRFEFAIDQKVFLAVQTVYRLNLHLLYVGYWNIVPEFTPIMYKIV